jgi:hypothetical protein
VIYSGFWDIIQRVIFVGRRFGTPYRFHLLGRNDQFDPEYGTDGVSKRRPTRITRWIIFQNSEEIIQVTAKA